VIVRDMWLTGFDAPCCHTMYIDKPMKGHNLMQAIARVNRVFKNKPGGLVVDYIGIANELKAALKTYTEAKGKGDPTHNAAEALSVLLEKMDIVRGMMHGFDYSAFETQAVPLLVPVANHILGLKDGKTRFLDTMVAVAKAFSLCGTLDEAAALRKEIAFFSAIKAAIAKFTTVDKKRSDAKRKTARSSRFWTTPSFRTAWLMCLRWLDWTSRTSDCCLTSFWKTCARWTAATWPWSCWKSCCATRSGPARATTWCRRRSTATGCWKPCASTTTAPLRLPRSLKS
jgi:hypothetical protein